MVFMLIFIPQLQFIAPKNHHQKTNVTLGGQRKAAISKQNAITLS